MDQEWVQVQASVGQEGGYMNHGWVTVGQTWAMNGPIIPYEWGMVGGEWGHEWVRMGAAAGEFTDSG